MVELFSGNVKSENTNALSDKESWKQHVQKPQVGYLPCDR